MTVGPAQIAIIILLIVLLFGAKKLPDLARSMGRSMRIFKSEVHEMGNDDQRYQEEQQRQQQQQQGQISQTPASQQQSDDDFWNSPQMQPRYDQNNQQAPRPDNH